MENGFLILKDTTILFPEPIFFECLDLNDWTSVPIPSLLYKINGCWLDNFLWEGLANPKLRSITVKGIIILKSASVIGEIFTL